jgi:hypothetical protein
VLEGFFPQGGSRLRRPGRGPGAGGGGSKSLMTNLASLGLKNDEKSHFPLVLSLVPCVPGKYKPTRLEGASRRLGPEVHGKKRIPQIKRGTRKHAVFGVVQLPSSPSSFLLGVLTSISKCSPPPFPLQYPAALGSPAGQEGFSSS